MATHAADRPDESPAALRVAVAGEGRVGDSLRLGGEIRHDSQDLGVLALRVPRLLVVRQAEEARHAGAGAECLRVLDPARRPLRQQLGQRPGQGRSHLRPVLEAAHLVAAVAAVAIDDLDPAVQPGSLRHRDDVPVALQAGGFGRALGQHRVLPVVIALPVVLLLPLLSLLRRIGGVDRVEEIHGPIPSPVAGGAPELLDRVGG